MKVYGLALDGNSNTPVVLLKEVDGERILPIWIGPAEANAIAMVLEGVKIERPLTHDLMKTIIEGLKAKVSKIVITDLKENTFYAKIYLIREQSIISIDARPSDSIALALRTKSPIYVDEVVLGVEPSHSEKNELKKEKEEEESLREYLQNLNPEDFGKYRLS